MPNLQAFVRAAIVVAGLSTFAKGEAMLNLPNSPLVSRSEGVCGAHGVPDLDNGYAIPMGADGTIPITMNNAIKSQYFSAQADGSGTGSSFQKASIVPTSGAEKNIHVQLPSGMKCTGGKQGNRCLVSIRCDVLKHTSCVLVEQSGSSSGGSSGGSSSSGYATGSSGGSSSGGSSSGGSSSGGSSTEQSSSGGSSSGESSSGGSSTEQSSSSGESSGGSSSGESGGSTEQSSSGGGSQYKTSGGSSSGNTTESSSNSGGSNTNSTSTANLLKVDNSSGNGTSTDKTSHLGQKKKCRRSKNQRRSVESGQYGGAVRQADPPMLLPPVQPRSEDFESQYGAIRREVASVKESKEESDPYAEWRVDADPPMPKPSTSTKHESREESRPAARPVVEEAGFIGRYARRSSRPVAPSYPGA